MGSSEIRPVFSIVIHTPSAIQAKIHAPAQRLTALNRRWTFSQITVANRGG